MTTALIIIFFLLGLILVLVEIFISPGFVAGVAGLIVLSVGAYMTFEHYGESKGWAFISISVAVLLACIFIAFKAGVWDKLALKGDIKGAIHVNDMFEPEIGMEGIAQSSIRPSGTAEFDSHTAEVHAQSEFIETKSKIKIVKIEDNRIFVTKK